MIAAVILSALAVVAGHPVQVVCDANLGGYAANPGEVARTPYGGSVIYVLPVVCEDSARAVGVPQFAYALGTLIHEAAHARGVRREACAELIANLAVGQVLRDYFHVEFFSAMSRRVAEQVLAQSRARPSIYNPDLCWRDTPS